MEAPGSRWNRQLKRLKGGVYYRRWARATRPSSNKFVDYVSGDIGKSEITAAVMIREPSVIIAKRVQNGRVKFVNVDRLVAHFEAEIVSGAVDQTSFNASAGH